MEHVVATVVLVISDVQQAVQETISDALEAIEDAANRA